MKSRADRPDGGAGRGPFPARIALKGVAAIVALAGGSLAAAPLPPRETDAVPVVMLADLGSGQVLTARASDRLFLPASMTKVMTEYVAFEEIAAGRLKLDRVFTVRPGTARKWRYRVTTLYLAPNAQVSADTLLHGIATVSANDAAVVLAEGYSGSVAGWTALMNREARRLGMNDSFFGTPNGWPDGGVTQVSARDLVTLASAMIRRHPQFYHRYFGQPSMVYDGRILVNHDPTLGIVAGADGIKTGHTWEAGFNFLGSATRDGRRLVMVIGGASTAPQRTAASRALLEWGYSDWRARPLFANRGIVARARVQGGAARFVPLVARGAVYASIPRERTQPVRLTVHYRGPLVAPVAKGAEIGELEIAVLGLPPGRIPLYAARSIGEAGPWDRVRDGLAHLLRL